MDYRVPNRMRQTLTIIVALGIIALFVLVNVKVPPTASPIRVGALPLGPGFVTLPNDGTYIAPCWGGTLPMWWAVFVYQSNRSNATFHLSGAWKASRPTDVAFGFSGNLTSMDDLRNWMPVAHCNPMLPSHPPPGPMPTPTSPLLPLSGSVDYDITTQPFATLFVLTLHSFAGGDVVEVTQPFAVTLV